MFQNNSLPAQQLPFSKKNREWRKKHLDWADNKTVFTDSLIRRSVKHKVTNYNLIDGILDMNDMNMVLNPESVKAGYVPDKIQHYPVINSKLNVIRGEESKRRFDARLIITNPNAISQIENNKKDELNKSFQQLLEQTAESEEAYNAGLEKLNDYYTYEWQDIREIRGNSLLTQYKKELSFDIKMNAGIMDVMAVGEEIYQCDIISGEPTLEKLNPVTVKVFKSGFSNKIEDADIITIENFLSPGQIIDHYYDSLTESDMKYIEQMPNRDSNSDDPITGNRNETMAFINKDEVFSDIMDGYALFTGVEYASNYIDSAGNIKVLKVYWKSRRKIKKVKQYDAQTGQETFSFYPETYTIDKTKGEEESIYWINEAWEGVKIGKEIYVNMRPRVVQYNRLSNPSRCHFGIVGSIYNINDGKPFSLVDMMKPYNYMYNAVHDRLNRAIAANWGKLLEADLALIPNKWSMDKWLYYAKAHHIVVKDSFKEGNIGPAKGKLAGNMANSSSGSIDAETGNYIQQHVNLLEFIKMEMAEVAGISKQREGQISNRETVGGVERATLQSSYITEWLFTMHDDVKKRVLECLLETAKIALKGRSKKFEYILSDRSIKIMEIDGDEFAECDYGLVVDNSYETQKLSQNLDSLAQAALQNQALSFSTIMKIYTNSSLAETQRLIEKDEQAIQKRNSEAAQADRDNQMQMAQLSAEGMEKARQQLDTNNMRDNETKLMIAKMTAFAGEETSEDVDYSPENKEKLLEQIREFDQKMALDREKFGLEKTKAAQDNANKQKELVIKQKQANKPVSKSK